MEIAVAFLILLFVLILCYPYSEDYYMFLNRKVYPNPSWKDNPLIVTDVPPEHDMVADRCKSYYMNAKDVQKCINSNCERLCNGRNDCFDSCSLWKLIHGE